jgi:uncharacterized DUF497 family protein
MEYEWDENKHRRNERVHGVSFAIMSDFDWSQAIEVLDDRFDYGEERWLAIGPIGSQLYAVSFTERGDNKLRIISLRPATRNERKAYVQAKS